jgi:acetyl-CoA acetyltransferase
MSLLRRAAAVGLIVFCGVAAQADDGSRSLDSASTGEAKSLDAAAGDESVGLDAVGADPSAPAPLPEIDDDAMRAEAQAARDAVLSAQRRAAQADAAYSKMRSRDYPQGDARAAIVNERNAAREAYAAANARYQELLEQLR